jgi:hypothetical protein
MAGDSQRLWSFESSDCPENKTTLDKVLDEIPVGWFHYRYMFGSEESPYLPTDS